MMQDKALSIIISSEHEMFCEIAKPMLLMECYVV